MKFVSIDVKTANSDPSTICEIGIGVFVNDQLVDKHREYFDPETPFNPIYIEKIHGITEEFARGWSPFDVSYDEIKELLMNNIVAHHSQLVRTGLLKALEKYNLDLFPMFWLDTEIVARLTWQEFSAEGCSLQEAASFLGIEIRYPDALSCSIAVGKIVIEACKKSGIGASELLAQVSKERI